MNENKDKKGKGILITIIIIVAIFTLLYWLLGVRGLLNILKWMFIILFILAILGTVFYFVWFFFFKKQKFDVTYVNKQKLLNACNRGNTGMLKGLFLSGDKGHNRVFWGRITGYCRISVLTRTLKYKVDKKTGEKTQLYEEDEKTPLYNYGKEEQDVFSISHSKTFIGRLFEEEDLVRVSPEDHDELIGDITIYGFSLIPISEYWFLNNDLLDVRKIDYAILKEAERGIMFEMLRDSKEIIDKASGLDTGHQKRIEERSLYEIPVNMGGGSGNK